MFYPQQVLNEFYLIQGQHWEGEQVHLQMQARPLVRRSTYTKHSTGGVDIMEM